MVKNTGGNKAKGYARKSFAKSSNILRVSEDKYEIYAQVIKILGNGMCYVICIDNMTRLCHIRGKFRGRGKRDNTIQIGSWCLIGLRDYEQESASATSSDSKPQNCDLLEVYTDRDKENLINTVTTINWSTFISNDYTNKNEEHNDIEFTDDKMDEYNNLIEMELSEKKSLLVKKEKEEIIDIDDI
jgi:translation initiation factor 1A